MDSEIPLPPPRRIRRRSPAPSGSAASSFHKQQPRRLSSRFDDRSSLPSSDPALFSSDDIPASGLENYHAPVTSGAGRKRRYRGTWWGEQVLDPKRKRADFKDKRHVDSGVWMGSDESAAESLQPSSEDALTWGEDLLEGNPAGPTTALMRGPVPVQLSVQARAGLKGPEESAEHRYAREVVNDCLEKGQDSIDLGNLHIRSIPAGLLRPLQHLTKLPSVREPPVSENVFSSLQPFLRIFLPNNSLSVIHNELFELNNLKVLSVRNNKLSEIPPMIRRLRGLQVLNISVNRLSYLPWELLWLLRKGELKHLIARPNPFLSIEESQIAKWHVQPDKKGESSPEDQLQFPDNKQSPPRDPIHVATGPTTWLNMEGNPLADGPAISTDQTSHPPYSPSLREVALRAISKLVYLEQISDAEMAEYPALVIPLLQRTREVRAGGGRNCSVCRRNYVIPRTEWLEWWDCTPHENGMKGPRLPDDALRPLPFRRSGCSWACAPSAT